MKPDVFSSLRVRIGLLLLFLVVLLTVLWVIGLFGQIIH